MNIELWYDPVVKETDVLVNGIPVEKNDVYGFLYPIRNYPIQSWLYPNGSWKGLESQVMDLARDEFVNLVFHGRTCDYDNVFECLRKSEMIKVNFVEWDVCTRYDELFSNLLSTLRGNDTLICELISSLNMDLGYKANFDVCIEDRHWMYHIREASDLVNADDAKDMSCCIVHSDFFSSYDKLHDLLALTRSLRVPADAIFCCFNQEGTKTDYEYYAKSFKRMGYRFYLESSDYMEVARLKYGLPAIVKLKIEKCRKIIQMLCTAYSKIKESTQDEFNKLKNNIVSLNQWEKDSYCTIKLLRDNSDRFQHGMKLIEKYIGVLLSVSKENKDETFHYECLDKLDENINIYLNASPFNEVI